MYENYPFKFLFEQNADTQILPASVTKVITSMVMLDYVKDLDETIEFISSDLIGGSGAVFDTGDVITYRDSLYALMLPSSNMTGQAIARCVGKKILEKL
jgi:D-alanyl-D-alanine carboxypeptidase